MRTAVGALEAAAVVIIAPECAACGRLLDRVAAGPVCEACWTAIRVFTPPLCDGCGDPLPSSRISAPTALCGHCGARRRAVSRARAIGQYDGILRDIIHAFKYDKRRSLGLRLGQLMRTAGATLLAGADVAVPVPLHWSRRRKRGFNQAELLAAQLGLPVWRALRRARRTVAQVELPAAKRHTNVEDAFALAWRHRLEKGARPLFRLAPAPRLEGMTVVLVDDVSTTGATLEACASVLRAAGVTEVRAITAARVASPPR